MLQNQTKMDGIEAFWIDAIPIKGNKFVIVTTGGSGHYKAFQLYDGGHLSLYDSAAVASSYHSFNMYWTSDNDSVDFTFNVEFYSDCEPNVAQKMPLQRHLRLLGAKLLSTPDRYYNPALALYEDLDKPGLSKESVVADRLSLGKLFVDDDEFRKYLLEKTPCYQFTKLDESYLELPDALQPNVSCLILRYPKPNQAMFPHDFATYVLLVRTGGGPARIEGIYRMRPSGRLQQISRAIVETHN
jgi:hypothetical protein